MIPSQLKNKVIKVESVEHGKEVIAFFEEVGATRHSLTPSICVGLYLGLNTNGEMLVAWKGYQVLSNTIITLSDARKLVEKPGYKFKTGDKVRSVEHYGEALGYTTNGEVIVKWDKTSLLEYMPEDYLHLVTITVTHAEIAQWKGCSVEQLDIKP